MKLIEKNSISLHAGAPSSWVINSYYLGVGFIHRYAQSPLIYIYIHEQSSCVDNWLSGHHSIRLQPPSRGRLTVNLASCSESAVLDSAALAQHMKNNPEAQGYLVDTSALGSDIVQAAKKVLKSANVSQDKIDSFLMTVQEFNLALGPLAKQFQKITVEDITRILSDKPEAVIYFRNRAAEARLLQETTEENTNSKLFTNMTPSVLSGLFVGLFLIITLLIGVSCLYDIKTNDKFARNNLWVGK